MATKGTIESITIDGMPVALGSEIKPMQMMPLPKSHIGMEISIELDIVGLEWFVRGVELPDGRVAIPTEQLLIIPETGMTVGKSGYDREITNVSHREGLTILTLRAV